MQWVIIGTRLPVFLAAIGSRSQIAFVCASLPVPACTGWMRAKHLPLTVSHAVVVVALFSRLVFADLAAASSSSSRLQPLLSSSSRSSSSTGWQQPTECQHCGTYCEWDDESEWEQK
jgi:hypothetical protein